MGEVSRHRRDGEGTPPKEAIHMPVMKNNQLLPRARELRRDMTPHERKLWYVYLRKYPIKIYKQRIIDSFIVDFYCARAKLVIEVDGSQHYTSQGLAYDSERTAMLAKYDLSVLRFTNYDIDHHFDAVCLKIDNEIQTRISMTSGESCKATDNH